MSGALETRLGPLLLANPKARLGAAMVGFVVFIAAIAPLANPTMLLETYAEPGTPVVLTDVTGNHDVDRVAKLAAGRFPNCKSNIRWLSSSAAEGTAPRSAASMKGLFNSIVS